MAIEKGLAKAEYLVFIQSPPRVRNFICLLRWWFLYSNSSQSHLHTTSPALKFLSSPSPEIYYCTNPNMSGILLHLHFKPDKIIFRVTFFLEGNFKLNIFFPCYLSFPFQSNFTFRLQITHYQERGNDPLLPSFPPWCVEKFSSAFPAQV